MTAKYNFSIKRQGEKGEETFQVINCDSFDEAIKIVEKGVYDRELKEQQEQNKQSTTLNPVTPVIPSPPVTPPTTTAALSSPANQDNDNNPQQGDQPIGQ